MDGSLANMIDPETGKRIKLHENPFYIAALKEQFIRSHNEGLRIQKAKAKKIPKVISLRDKQMYRA